MTFVPAEQGPDRADRHGKAAPEQERRPTVGDRETARILDKASTENFPVASRVLPRAVRADLLAIYGYARMVDDAGDEAEGDREALLDEIDADIDRVYAGVPRHPVMRRLAATVAAHHIPAEPLRKLVAANRQDQRVSRYDTHEQLLGYCELSANPVGALVLHVFDAATPARLRRSDAICTALQLVEHWQDVAEDRARGRVYLPARDLAAYGCQDADLLAASASPRLRAVLALCVRRAADLLDAGAPLVGTLTGFARIAVAGYLAGGRATVDALRAADFDVLGRKVRPSAAGTAAWWLRALAGHTPRTGPGVAAWPLGATPATTPAAAAAVEAGRDRGGT